MKIKCLIVAMLLALTTSSVVAQQSKSDSSVEFNPHWSMGLQGGAAYTLGETAFGDLISPAFYLNGAYKFTSVFGLRLGVGGITGKGYSSFASTGYEFNFVPGNLDAMFDLSALFCGFNHKRIMNVYAFAGAGLFYGFDNDEAAKIKKNGDDLRYLWTDNKAFVAGRFGLGSDFRCSERFSISVEANANVLSDHFNSKKAGNADWQFALLAGVNYKFGKNNRPSASYADKLAAEKAAQEAAERAAKEAAEKAAKEKAAKEAAAKAAAEAAAKEAAAKAAAAKRSALAAENSKNVFFLINSAKIRKSEAQKLEQMVEFLKANNDYSVAIVGYADKETGNSDGNMKLSERRAQAVKKFLVDNGIAESRIATSFKGDTVQPLEGEKNRVVICTVE